MKQLLMLVLAAHCGAAFAQTSAPAAEAAHVPAPVAVETAAAPVEPAMQAGSDAQADAAAITVAAPSPAPAAPPAVAPAAPPGSTPAAASAMAAPAAPAGDASKAILFNATARVEVDARGEVMVVDPDPGLSHPIAEEVRRVVAGARFEPPMLDGRTVAGVTYVRLHGCAAPAADGVHMHLRTAGNGPRRLDRSSPMPPLSVRVRDDEQVALKVLYRVGPDGRATVERIDTLRGREPVASTFVRSVERWITQGKYEPERLDGEAVPTRMEMPVDFSMMPNLEKSRRESIGQDASCQVLLDQSQLQPVQTALDSPFKLSPAG